MAKLNDNKIEKSDIEEYISSKSDFSFEMKVFNLVEQLGFYTEHGGTYIDPFTKKPREFDVRAEFEDGKIKYYLAIEVKNIKQNFPLVISCVPRLQDESYHDIIISDYDSTATIENGLERFGINKKILGGLSFYREKDFVGKSSDQVGRHDHTDEIVANDSQIYDKWAQAVNSVYDLVERAYYISKDYRGVKSYACLSLPILVVPDNTLWQINYDDKGNLVSGPFKTNRCSYFINKSYKVGDDLMWNIEHDITHLEILTFSGLKNFIKESLFDKNERLKIFPPQEIDKYL